MQTAAWANQKTASRLCKAAMLRRHHKLTAKLTDLQKAHRQLPSADSQMHSCSTPMAVQHLCAVSPAWQEQQSDGPMSSGHACGVALDQQAQLSVRPVVSHCLCGVAPDWQEQQSAGPIFPRHACGVALNQQEQQAVRPVVSHHLCGVADGQQEEQHSVGPTASEHPGGVAVDNQKQQEQQEQQQQQQQSASTAAAQSCSSGVLEGCEGAGKSYRQCKLQGSMYGRQWQQLRRHELFSDWMHKPQQLEDFPGFAG